MEPARLTGCVVLVVEDEPLVSLDLVDVLSAAGAHVVCAKKVCEAIQSVERFQVSPRGWSQLAANSTSS